MPGIVSQYLSHDAGVDFKIVPEVSDGRFSMFNDGGVECEVGEFLYALTYMLKPERVLETGTHRGVSASYIGLGLQANGGGVLDTYEFLDPHYKYSKDLIRDIKLQDYVKVHLADVAELETETKYQLILLDTEPQTRFAEFIKFVYQLEFGGFIFIHDLHRHMQQINNAEHGFAWPYGKLPQDIKEMVNQGLLRPWHFPTPRGLTGFYKVHPEDYLWNTNQ